MNDKKMKHPYFWYGRSFTGLDRRFSQPQHSLKPKPNPEQDLKFLQFYKGWEKWANCQRVSQFSSVTQSCLTLCNPMDCSRPGFPVHHQVPKLAQTHVYRVRDAIQPSHPLSSPSPPAFNLSQHQGLFQWVGSSNQMAKYWSFTFSISPSSEYQDWFPSGWTGWISLQSKGLSGALSNITVQKHVLGSGLNPWEPTRSAPHQFWALALTLASECQQCPTVEFVLTGVSPSSPIPFVLRPSAHSVFGSLLARLLGGWKPHK